MYPKLYRDTYQEAPMSAVARKRGRPPRGKKAALPPTFAAPGAFGDTDPPSDPELVNIRDSLYIFRYLS